MSIHTRTGQKSSGTDRVWKWTDQSDEPSIIPDTWAANGAHEEAVEGETLFFAVEVRAGLLLEYDTNDRGQATGVANREQAATRTLYVSADGGRGVVIESQAQQSGDSITPQGDWASVIARPASAGQEVDAERRDAYRALIRELYGEVEN